MIFIERYPLKRCQGCVKLIASKVNCFLNINDLSQSEVQLCMSSNCLTAGPESVHIPKMVLIMFLKKIWVVYIIESQTGLALCQKAFWGKIQNIDIWLRIIYQPSNIQYINLYTKPVKV